MVNKIICYISKYRYVLICAIVIFFFTKSSHSTLLYRSNSTQNIPITINYNYYLRVCDNDPAVKLIDDALSIRDVFINWLKTHK